MNSKDKREWINTFVGIAGVIILLYGALAVNNINIKLNDIKANSVSAKNFLTIDENGTITGCDDYIINDTRWVGLSGEMCKNISLGLPVDLPHS